MLALLASSPCPICDTTLSPKHCWAVLVPKTTLEDSHVPQIIEGMAQRTALLVGALGLISNITCFSKHC